MDSIKSNAFNKRIHKALKGWHKNSEDDESLLGDLHIVADRLETFSSSLNQRQATNAILEEGIELLATSSQEKALILTRRFKHNDTITQVAYLLEISDDQLNRRQREAIHQLSDILWDKEIALREQEAAAFDAELPAATYKKLFGYDSLQVELAEKLTTDNALNVVSITGIGGIGKTSLCDAVVRRVIRSFVYDRIIWLRVDSPKITDHESNAELILDIVSSELIRQLQPESKEQLLRKERFQQIRYFLNQKRYLVVIDNLERAADTSSLLQYLDGWAGQSKFLVTTRARLTGQASILSYELSELPKDDAMAFVKYQAQETGLSQFANDIELLIDDIYEVTGGNPLALKLVISLIAFMPLDAVLSSLRQGSGTNNVDSMYNRIYKQAWLTLTHDGRELLQAMPIVGSRGGEVELLQAMSGLDATAIWAAISDLVNRSLIEVRGDYRKRRYGVHQLTMTFLKSEIINGKWDFE